MSKKKIGKKQLAKLWLKDLDKLGCKLGDLGLAVLLDAEADKGELCEKQADAARAVMAVTLMNIGRWIHDASRYRISDISDVIPPRDYADEILSFAYDTVGAGVAEARDSFEGKTIEDVYDILDRAAVPDAIDDLIDALESAFGDALDNAHGDETNTSPCL